MKWTKTDDGYTSGRFLIRKGRSWWTLTRDGKQIGYTFDTLTAAKGRAAIIVEQEKHLGPAWECQQDAYVMGRFRIAHNGIVLTLDDGKERHKLAGYIEANAKVLAILESERLASEAPEAPFIDRKVGVTPAEIKAFAEREECAEELDELLGVVWFNVCGENADAYVEFINDHSPYKVAVDDERGELDTEYRIQTAIGFYNADADVPDDVYDKASVWLSMDDAEEAAKQVRHDHDVGPVQILETRIFHH